MKQARDSRTTTDRQFGAAELRSLGRFIRDRRRGAGQSIKQLADLSGVAVSSISHMETGRVSPSLANVINVLNALGADIDGAIEAAFQINSRVVVKRAAEVSSDATQTLSDSLQGGVLQAQLLALPKDRLSPLPDKLAGADVFGMVLDGQVALTRADGEALVMQTGDAWHMRRKAVSTWSGAGAEPARMLLVSDRRGADDTTPAEGN